MDYDLMLALIEAKKNNKPIYYRKKGSNNWIRLPVEESFDFIHMDYSMEPVIPKLLYVNIYSDGEIYAHTSEENAAINADITTNAVYSEEYIALRTVQPLIEHLVTDPVMLPCHIDAALNVVLGAIRG